VAAHHANVGIDPQRDFVPELFVKLAHSMMEIADAVTER
jgi:hypothetical protein